MMLVLAQLYFSLNLLLLLLGLSLGFHQRFSAPFVLRLQYFLLASFALFGAALVLFPERTMQPAVIELRSVAEPDRVAIALRPPGVTAAMTSRPLPATEWGNILELGGALLAFFAIFSLILALWRIYKIFAAAFISRKLGGLRIYYSDHLHEPFSFWAGRLYILLPLYLLEDKRALRVILAHELQHHRQGDLRWAYVFCLFRVLCFWNPGAHFYIRKVFEVQEFACDEVLVDRQHVPPQAYARHLLWVAERVRATVPLCTSGFVSSRLLLKRRIEKMIKLKRTQELWLSSTLVLGSSLAFLVAAWGANGILQDRRVDFSTAQALAKKVEAEEFPLPVNEEVLKFLNVFLATEAGREKISRALERMETYRPLIEKKLAEYGMPEELMAIPVVESGYQNLPDPNKNGWGAGLWMFIKGTARNYGLRVDDTVDQRLDEKLLTDAAMRLLGANKLRFHHWHLSVLAYNGGEGHVQRLIDKTQSRDPWVLVQAGAESDRNYLAKVLAAAIIMKNPELLR